MKWHFLDMPINLYHGNSMEVLPDLIAGGCRAHCLVSDPPYLLTSGGVNPSAEHKKMSGIFNTEKYDNGGHLVACDIDWNDFMPLFYDILDDRAHAYVMANNRNVAPLLNAAAKARFEFHNLLVWDKVTATPNRWYMKNCEFTGFFYKGAARQINDCASMSCIRYPHRDESAHPTEKPVGLMEYYILNSTQPGDVVIDPFMGSGSTGVAAVRTGRRFIGIESDAQWYATAQERIREAQQNRQEILF